MGSYSTFSGAGLLSIGSPSTLNILPRHASPTGTFMGLPLDVASIPLTSPSVGPIATHLTVSSPRCCATSATRVVPSLLFTLTASLISGSPSVNLMSSTAPMTCVSLPFFSSAIFVLPFVIIYSFSISLVTVPNLQVLPVTAARNRSLTVTQLIAFAPAMISVSSCVMEP